MFMLRSMSLGCQVAEAALADEHVRGGERLDLQRRILRLGKPPRRWKTPSWASSLPHDPPEVRLPPPVAPFPKGLSGPAPRHSSFTLQPS